jgi:D-threo-aldose 1-dehydrogenase
VSEPTARPRTRLGFGVSGAHGTPLVRRAQTLALIERAAELGVTVFDTAPAYGNGEAERRLGAALRRLGRDRFHVMTKAGLSSHGLAGRRRDFSPEAIEASVRGSLIRLGVEGVDTLFLHGPDPSELTPALMDRLAALRRAGAFAALGLAGRAQELGAVLETPGFDAVMAPVHPFLDTGEIVRLERIAAAGLHIIAIETAGDAPAPMAMPRVPADLYKLARALRPSSPGRGRTRVLDGLRAALARGWVDCVLTTTARPSHLQQSARVSMAEM